jgi:predicted GIY-YIG superfamily endonuclease
VIKKVTKELKSKAIVSSKVEGFYVYILRTSANTLYIGQTNNLEKRMAEHKSKTIKSSKYVRSFPSFELVYSEQFNTRSDAMKREWQLKKWSKDKKEALVKGDKLLLKRL